jgi:hypothetical protein
LETHVSYFIGADPEKWRADVPVWGGVRYHELYPGVDLVVGAAPAPDDGRPQGSPLQWRLEGADLGAVRLRVEGADAAAVEKDALRLSTALGDFAVPLLQAAGSSDLATVQPQGPQAFEVAAPFASVRPNPQSAIGNRQSDGLPYATFLGGRGWDHGQGIAVDGAGQAYVTGATGSADFPASLDPGYDTSYNGGSLDAFVVKLDAAGSGLLYATFLGGSSYETGNGIAVDGAGEAYVTGWTASADFPATLGPGYDTSLSGGGDAFVVKLDAAGSGLRYATFLGGWDSDKGFGIAVDGAGQAYVTGLTRSADFPASRGPGYDTSFNGDRDAFVVKLDTAGASLRYATFLGGNGEDWGTGIAVDGAGQVYVTGLTWSAGFPASLGPGYDTSLSGGGDAFVVKLLAGPPPSPAILGTIWHDLDGDGTRDAGEPGIADVQVCAQPLGHRAVRCATSGPAGSYTIELDAAGTYLVAPSGAPEGMRLTTPGFRLPVVVREGQQAWNVDFGYR